MLPLLEAPDPLLDFGCTCIVKVPVSDTFFPQSMEPGSSPHSSGSPLNCNGVLVLIGSDAISKGFDAVFK